MMSNVNLKDVSKKLWAKTKISQEKKTKKNIDMISIMYMELCVLKDFFRMS